MEGHGSGLSRRLEEGKPRSHDVVVKANRLMKFKKRRRERRLKARFDQAMATEHKDVPQNGEGVMESPQTCPMSSGIEFPPVQLEEWVYDPVPKGLPPIEQFQFFAPRLSAIKDAWEAAIEMAKEAGVPEDKFWKEWARNFVRLHESALQFDIYETLVFERNCSFRRACGDRF